MQSTWWTGLVVSCLAFMAGCSESDPVSNAPASCNGADPCLNSAQAFVRDDGLVGVVFEGQGLETNVRRLNIDVLDDAGELLDTHYTGEGGLGYRFPPAQEYGEVSFDAGGGFRGFRVMTPTPLPSRLRLEVIDTNEAEVDSLELDLLSAAPRAVNLGESCDFDGLLYTCPDGTFCEQLDGAERALCLEPVTDCSPNWQVSELGTAAEGDLLSAPDETVGSCSNQRGDIGYEQVYRYSPKAAGTYRFQAVGDAATLFARRYCNMPQPGASELGCVSFDVTFPVENSSATLDLALDAGQVLFVFVEAPWFGGGAYQLTVQQLE